METFRSIRTFLVCILLLMVMVTNSDATNNLNNDEMVTFAVHSALKEGMQTGFHGSIAKARHYMGSDENKITTYLAWFHTVNAFRIIEASLEVASQSREKEQLKSELDTVKRMVDRIARNSFNWNRDQTTEQLIIAKFYLNKKISDFKVVDF